MNFSSMSLPRHAIVRAMLVSVPLLAAGCGGSDSPSPIAAPVPVPTPAPAPPPPPPSTLSQVNALIASTEALWATAVPASGAARMSLTDGCYFDDGRSRAFNITDIDANLPAYAARDAYRIGEKRTNLQVLAERNTINSDGSARKEVDVQFDVVYLDGSSAKSVKQSLIGGSSFGTPDCATPQVSSDLRYLGNWQDVRIEVRPRNLREERYSLAGVPLTPAVTYRRDVQFFVTDPMGHAKYVIVTGPGPAGAGGEPFSLKLISPRLLREAPELAGKNGNFLNWKDDDRFRFCRIVGPSVPVATSADCVGQGATGDNWGWTTGGSPSATDDTGFQSQGWVAGATYSFAVYDDDGWKTVNGQSGRTPVATYTTKLPRLPYDFVAMAGTGPATDNFPRFTAPADPVQLAANVTSATPSPINVAWSALPANIAADGMRLFSLYEFFQGAKSTNLGATFYPAYRLSLDSYPGSTAAAFSGMNVTAKLPEMTSKSYAEFGLVYLDRNDSLIISIISFD